MDNPKAASLNYHHLLYFWAVAHEGSVTRAGELLHVAQQTISGQLRTLETQLGVTLFERKGRSLVLTPVGETVYRYACEIFALGEELVESVQQAPRQGPARLVVGILDTVPPLVAHHLLKVAFDGAEPVHLVCHTGKLDRLMADLALQELDLVIADRPVGPDQLVRAHCRVLTECGVTVLGHPALAARYRPDFPTSLHEAPMLLPTASTTLRGQWDDWCASLDLKPTVVGEFDDVALMTTFAEAGVGLIIMPSLAESELGARPALQVVGQLPTLRERYYAISTERRFSHPLVKALLAAVDGDQEGS